MKIFFLCLLAFGPIAAINTEQLHKALTAPNPFPYNLRARVFPSENPNSDVLVAFHGFGGDCKIGATLRNNKAIHNHVVSFNFPDANISATNYNPYTTSFGTIQELLPPLYLLKQLVNNGAERLSLYGFSAGGGAVINLIAVLNRTDYDADLQSIGITPQMKQKILNALQKGTIVLDVPLKSFGEIIAIKGGNSRDRVLADRAVTNRLNPIDALKGVSGLSLKILIHFQYPDEAIPNRDDNLFVQNVTKANSNGATWAIYGSDGGHCAYHTSLWDAYFTFLQPNAAPTKLIDRRL